MKKFVINHTEIFVELASVCFWIWIADKHLRFLQTKHLQCNSNLDGALCSSLVWNVYYQSGNSVSKGSSIKGSGCGPPLMLDFD